LRLPLLPFVGAAVALETSLRPLGIQPPLHRRRLDFFRKSFAFSTDKARQLLGFKPQHDLRSGTADTARWYRTHGFLQESRP
jgi:nucleoside-diphosphate-sugar epimerase